MNNLWSELTKNSLTNSLSFLAFVGNRFCFNWVSQLLLQGGFPPQTSSADRVDTQPSLMIFRRVSVSDTQPVHEGGSTRFVGKLFNR